MLKWLAKKQGWFIFLLISGILIFLEVQNFLLFHLGVELFSIIIAGSMFTIAVNTKEIAKNDYLLFLGAAYGFIAGIDLLHTVTYEGMEIVEAGSNLPTQLWIAARYLESFCLAGSFFYLDHSLKLQRTFIMLTVVSILVVKSIFMGYFPDCFVAGTGLTLFKIVSEYIIIGLLLIAIWLLWYYRSYFIERSYYFMLGALLTTILGEVAFTLYLDVYDLSNVVGHVFKLISFYFIYKAIIEATLQNPYESLFYKLTDKMEKIKVQKQKLEVKNKDLEESYTEIDSINEELKSTQEKLITTNERLKQRIEAGRRFHLQFMENELPEVKELAAVTYYLPAEEIGGDLYDMIKVEDKLIFYLVDITGHGIDGAFLNVFVKETINNFLVNKEQFDDLSPQRLLRYINQRFRAGSFPDDYFICLLLFVVDLTTYQVAYVNSGFQSLPLIIKKGKLKQLTATEAPISPAVPAESYQFAEESFYLGCQDIILAATDGLIEEEAAGERYGLERMSQQLAANQDYPPQVIIDRLLDDFCQFAELPQTDDITLLAVRREAVENKFTIQLNSNYDYLKSVKGKLEQELLGKTGDFRKLMAGIHEIVINAIQHGNQGDADKVVQITGVVTASYVKIIIEDEGSGFNWKQHLEGEMKQPALKDGGLGLVMTNRICDGFAYNQAGNKAVLVKFRE